MNSFYRRITPDYSRGISISATSVNITIPDNGIITANFFVQNQASYSFYVNDIYLVSVADYSSGGGTQQIYFPVKKGDKYRGNTQVQFIPFI